ncbi:threonine ammonia-lyase [Nocardioides sp. WS12]|uniref:threonine ammonia-lyase n=1 Tax=Nocardioides sp. WS12 TaxID=2486272 RepID=UPI0015FD77F6|nr:threonine ammonia-lyase [Nocardioides sp. WS12]
MAENRVTKAMLEEARTAVTKHAYHTPLVTSRLLSEHTGLQVWLKAEPFQRTGSYKFRGPLNKFSKLSDEQRNRGVVCSSAGNHAQGVALAAQLEGIRAVVVMAENATPSKIEATKAYGAEVILHGQIWDEANEMALKLVEEQGLTYIHPFDDLELISGQGTLGMEIMDDLPDVDVVIAPIGGGGLISGVASAVKHANPATRVIGVESSEGPAMLTSVRAGELVTLDKVDTIIDGLRVKRVGENNLAIVRELVDEIVTVPDADIFAAMVWVMNHAKIVVEGAAAAPVAALLQGIHGIPAGSKVVCVLSGGNLDLSQLNGRRWN